MYSRPRKLLAELLGTFAVVLVCAGAVCMDEFLRRGNDPVLGFLGLALAYGVTFGAAVCILGPVSGGHFNPAVTLGHWVTHSFNTFDTLTYSLAQLAGAACAGYLLRLAVPEEIWRAVALGTPDLANGLTRAPGMLIEGLMTFFLVLSLSVTSAGKPGARYWLAGLASGLVIVAAVFFGGSYTGAAMNPARAFGPALASSQWTNQGVYWVGPLAGGVAAASLYELLFVRKRSLPG